MNSESAPSRRALEAAAQNISRKPHGAPKGLAVHCVQDTRDPSHHKNTPCCPVVSSLPPCWNVWWATNKDPCSQSTRKHKCGAPATPPCGASMRPKSQAIVAVGQRWETPLCRTRHPLPSIAFPTNATRSERASEHTWACVRKDITVYRKSCSQRAALPSPGHAHKKESTI